MLETLVREPHIVTKTVLKGFHLAAGWMMAVILLTDNDVYTVAEQAQTGVVLLVVLLLTYILLLFSDAILRIIGRQGAAILVRVMGIILCSLAVEIVLTTLAVASWAPVPR